MTEENKEISSIDALKKLVFSNGAKWLGAFLLAALTGTSGVYYGQNNNTSQTNEVVLQLPDGVTNAEFHQIAPNTYVVVPIKEFWVGNVVDGKWEFKQGN